MINEMELENKKEEVKMPWQSKILIFIRFLILSSSFILVLKINSSDVSGRHAGLFFWMFAFIFFINTFLVVGILIKKKYFLIFSIMSSLFASFFYSIIFVGFYSDTMRLFPNNQEVNNFVNYIILGFFFVILFQMFLIYLAYKSFKHPFYNQKKIKI